MCDFRVSVLCQVVQKHKLFEVALKRLLIAYFIGNISAKKYQNPFMCVKVIANQMWDVFLRHGVGLDYFLGVAVHAKQANQALNYSVAVMSVIKKSRAAIRSRSGMHAISPRATSAPRMRSAVRNGRGDHVVRLCIGGGR